MALPDARNLVPSVLDRLLGDELPTDAELVRFRARVIRRRKEALCRDLENLLNTRRRCTAPPTDLTELETSLVNYGIPDFTGTNAESLGGRDELLQAIEDAIARYEPRLRQVRITPLASPGSSHRRVLRFRIEGAMLTDGEPEPVAFASVLEPTSGNFLLEREAE